MRFFLFFKKSKSPKTFLINSATSSSYKSGILQSMCWEKKMHERVTYERNCGRDFSNDIVIPSNAENLRARKKNREAERERETDRLTSDLLSVPGT